MNIRSHAKPGEPSLWRFGETVVAFGPIGAQRTPFDGLPVGSVGDPCDVFSWTEGHPMAIVAPGLASRTMEEH